MDKRQIAFVVAMGISLPILAGDGVFTSPGGEWSVPENWENGLIADGPGSTAELRAELSNDVTIVLPDGGVTNGSLTVTNTSENVAVRSWTLDGLFTFDRGDAADSVVMVATNAALSTKGIEAVNDVVKTGPGQWNLRPTGSMFQSSQLIIREGVCHLANASYSKPRIMIDPRDGGTPTLSICGDEKKSNGPEITVATGSGSPLIKASGNGKVYDGKLVLQRMVEFDLGGSGTFFGSGISGVGGIRKTGSGTLTFGTGPAFDGEFVLSQGGFSGGSTWWNNDHDIAVTIGDADSKPENSLWWSFSEKGSTGGRTSFHVTQYGGPVTFQWAKSQKDATHSSSFVLDRDVTFNANVGGGCGNTFSGRFSGAGGIAFKGLGVDRYFRLTGENTYSGGTSIDSVTVKAGGNSALGAGDVEIGATGKLVYDADVSNVISDGAILGITTGAVVDFGTHTVKEAVGGLVVDGKKQGGGLYGALDNDQATVKVSWISGSGLLKVRAVGIVVIYR